MSKKIEESTRLVIDSLPANLKRFVYSVIEDGCFLKEEFLRIAKVDDVQDEELNEIVEFLEQDLGLELLESDSIDYSDDEDDDNTYKGYKDESNEVDMEDEEYNFYAKQLEKSNLGTISFGVQDSVQSYLKQINTVQLLTAAGEVAIAKRIEVASKLVMFALCESPITINYLLSWFNKYQMGDVRLGAILDLDLMYSAFVDKKERKTIDKSEECIEDNELEDDDETSDEDDEEELSVVTRKKSSSGVPVAVAEETLTPIVCELFSKISKIFTKIEKIQKERLDGLLESSVLDNKLEEKYLKLRLELFNIIHKMYFVEDRILEVLDILKENTVKLMGLEGKMYRLAKSVNKKLTLQDFIEEWSGNEINMLWTKKLLKSKSNIFTKFAKQYNKEIIQIQKDIYNISSILGQPIFEYKNVVDLVRQGQREAEKAKKEMVKANLRLVVKSARKCVARAMGLDLSDLIQDGNSGLMKAVDKFDYRLGNKFSTYATNWITQSITRSISCNGRTIRIPVHMIDNISKKDKAIRRFMHKFGREPTVAEISKMTSLSEDKIYKAMKINVNPIPIEKPFKVDDDENDRSQVIPNDKAKDPIDYAVQKNLRRVLTLTLATLEPTEEMVLRKRKGIGGENIEYTLEEVGTYLGLTRERVRQIQEKAKNKLLHPTRAKILRSFYEN